MSFHQFWLVLASFDEFWAVLSSLEIRYNLFTINLHQFHPIFNSFFSKKIAPTSPARRNAIFRSFPQFTQFHPTFLIRSYESTTLLRGAWCTFLFPENHSTNNKHVRTMLDLMPILSCSTNSCKMGHSTKNLTKYKNIIQTLRLSLLQGAQKW